MATSGNSAPSLPPRLCRAARRAAAFSLVEVVLAIGIVAFALVPVFGLIPIGLSSFRKGTDLSVSSQITQRLVDEAQQSDFETLTDRKTDPFAKPARYFDAEGQETTANQPGAIYLVNTRVAPSTAMTGGDAGSGVTNLNIATVTVQVANNPGHQSLRTDTTTGLWVSTSGVSITTASSYVARNSALPAVTNP